MALLDDCCSHSPQQGIASSPGSPQKLIIAGGRRACWRRGLVACSWWVKGSSLILVSLGRAGGWWRGVRTSTHLVAPRAYP